MDASIDVLDRFVKDGNCLVNVARIDIKRFIQGFNDFFADGEEERKYLIRNDAETDVALALRLKSKDRRDIAHIPMIVHLSQ